MNKVTIIFICHDENSVNFIVENNQFEYIIMYVGKNDINQEHKKKINIIICRELMFNIEDDIKLLTFTAWYAIIKNNLFLDYDYICILEYDVKLENNFNNNLIEFLSSSPDVVSFEEGNRFDLTNNVNVYLLKQFMIKKKINPKIVNQILTWGCSTNQCIKREILEKFVNWYYPDCNFIKQKDYKKYSFYHERLFMIFLSSLSINYKKMNGLIHLHNKCHFNKF